MHLNQLLPLLPPFCLSFDLFVGWWSGELFSAIRKIQHSYIEVPAGWTSKFGALLLRAFSNNEGSPCKRHEDPVQATPNLMQSSVSMGKQRLPAVTLFWPKSKRSGGGVVIPSPFLPSLQSQRSMRERRIQSNYFCFPPTRSDFAGRDGGWGIFVFQRRTTTDWFRPSLPHRIKSSGSTTRTGTLFFPGIDRSSRNWFRTWFQTCMLTLCCCVMQFRNFNTLIRD